MTAGLVSIGYEGLTLEALVARLRINDVVALADVRLNAISRKRGFSKRALASGLAEAGIEYVHLPELGNQRENRSGYASLETPEARAARETFTLALMKPEAQHALSRLRQLAETGKVAVFCYEGDEKRCHREQVLAAVRTISLATT